MEMLMLHLPRAASHRRLCQRQIKLRAAAPVLGELLFYSPLMTSFCLVAKLKGCRRPFPPYLLFCRLICLMRIYNFWCSMLVYTPFALCFVYTSWRFYTFSGTNLLTRYHSVSSCFLLLLCFRKVTQEIFSELDETKAKVPNYLTREDALVGKGL
jgi:hypothetical protein